MTTPGRRTGRRPGNPATREAIVGAARALFAEIGFTRATIRAIAERAGVDPALVHHYFGTKKDLFLAATALPVDPTMVVGLLLAEGHDDLGRRLVGTLIGVWDGPIGPGLIATMRAIVADDAQLTVLREFIITQVVYKILTAIDTPAAEIPLRASLVASQVIGLAVARYLLRVAPLADLPAEQVAALIGPTLQRYLTGPL